MKLVLVEGGKEEDNIKCLCVRAVLLNLEMNPSEKSSETRH